MFSEVGASHHRAHFHAYYQEQVAVFGIDPVEIISGSLPRRQQRLVEAWAELHQMELNSDWERLQDGQSPLPIDPLR
jgi:hypothetical protein